MRNSAHLLLVVASLLMLTTASRAQSDDLIEFLVAANEKSMRALPPCLSYTVSCDVKTEDGTLRRTNQSRVVRRNQDIWCEWAQKTGDAAVFRVFRTHDAAGMWLMGTANPQYWELNGEFDEVASDSVNVHLPADPVMYMGGDGSMALREVITAIKKRANEPLSCVEKAPGRYVICSTPVGFTAPRFEYHIDASLGYAVHETVGRLSDGETHRVKIRYGTLPESSQLFPITIERWDKARPDKDRVFTISDVTISSVGDDAFGIESLGVPDGKNFSIHLADGKTKLQVLREGILIDLDADMMLQRAANANSKHTVPSSAPAETPLQEPSNDRARKVSGVDRVWIGNAAGVAGLAVILAAILATGFKRIHRKGAKS